MQEFFINTCTANTLPKTLMIYSTLSIWSFLGFRFGKKFLPLGHYGVRSLRELNSFKAYGVSGILGPVAMMALSAYTWYRASIYTGNFIIDNILYGKRDYLNLYTSYNNEFGNYAFSDHTFLEKKTARNFGGVVKSIEKIKNEMHEENKQKIFDALESLEAEENQE